MFWIINCYLFNNDFLGLYVISINQTQHIHAWRPVRCRDVARRVSTFDKDVTQQVNQLEGGVAVNTVDNDITIGIDEGEIAIRIGSTFAKHQLET